MHRIRNAKRIILSLSHHLGRIPGIPSFSPSPPEYRFAGFTGELFTNVGPLEAGLGNAGVEVLFDLQSAYTQQSPYIPLLGLSCLILAGLFGEGKSFPPAFHKSNDEVPEFFMIGLVAVVGGLNKSVPTLTLCFIRMGVCSTGPYFRRKLARLAPLAP
jgi:hypothetical protein